MNNEMNGIRIDAHAHERIATRLNASEARTFLQRVTLSASRSPAHSQAIVGYDLKTRRMTDSTGNASNGNLVIGIVRSGVLETVMLRRDTQEVSKRMMRTERVAWAGVEKRSTTKGRKPRRW
jgi:hypothetical protein